jgi:hypothetical protein
VTSGTDSPLGLVENCETLFRVKVSLDAAQTTTPVSFSDILLHAK